MELKIGDYVVCITSISPGLGGPLKGEKYRITSIFPGRYIGFKLARLKWHGVDIKEGIRPNWGIDCFELARTRWEIIPKRARL